MFTDIRCSEINLQKFPEIQKFENNDIHIILYRDAMLQGISGIQGLKKFSPNRISYD